MKHMLAATGAGAEFAEVVNLMLGTATAGRLKQRGVVLTSYTMQFPKNRTAKTYWSYQISEAVSVKFVMHY